MSNDQKAAGQDGITRGGQQDISGRQGSPTGQDNIAGRDQQTGNAGQVDTDNGRTRHAGDITPLSDPRVDR